MTQSGNPGGELRCISDIPTQKCEGWRGLRRDGVGLRMTETEKYNPGFTRSRIKQHRFSYQCSDSTLLSLCRVQRQHMWLEI